MSRHSPSALHCAWLRHVVGGTVEGFAKFLREDIERYRKLTAAAGIEPQ